MADSQKTLSRIELIEKCAEWGITNLNCKSNQVLLKELVEAIAIQKQFETDAEVDDLNKMDLDTHFQYKWEDGITLRRLGCDYETLSTLLSSGIKNIDQLMMYTKENLVDYGVSTPQAQMLHNKYNKMMSPVVMTRESPVRSQRISPAEQASIRVNKRKWPNGKQSFSEFIDILEYDLRIMDYTKETWMDQVLVILEGDTRKTAEKIKTENIYITYDEWKRELIKSTITSMEITESLFTLLQRKYNVSENPKEHFVKMETALKIVIPDACDKTIALIMSMTLPQEIQNELIPDHDVLETEKLKRNVLGLYQKYKSPAKLPENQNVKIFNKKPYEKGPQSLQTPLTSSANRGDLKGKTTYQPGYEKPRCPCCYKIGHSKDKCWKWIALGKPEVESTSQGNNKSENKTSYVNTEDPIQEGQASVTRLMINSHAIGVPDNVRYPIVNIKVNQNLVMKGLVDTGACTTLISQSVAAKIGLLAYPVDIRFQSIDSSMVKSTYFVPIRVYKDNQVTIMAAYVINGLSNEIIIGENIIKFTQLIIRAKGPKQPYELTQGDLITPYKLEIETPNLHEIESLLKNWYKDKYDMNRLFLVTNKDPNEIQRGSDEVNRLRINLVNYLTEAYPDHYPNLVNKIETFQETIDDFPGDVKDLNRRLYDQINPELTVEERKQIHKVLMEEKESFSSSKYDLGCVPASVTKFKIDINGKAIPKSKPFRSSEKMKEEMRKIIKEFKDNDIIENSDVGGGAPAFVVPKSNGTWRMVTSYIELNKLVEKRQYPMPNIDDAINKLKGNKYFTTLDLAQGYYQLEIPEEERDKTSFVTEDGCYRYKRLPMGLADAPSYFQEVINKVLGELKYTCCFGYFDDIVIYGKSITELCDRMKLVIGALKSYGLKNRVEKLQAGVTSFVCLGHLVSGKTVQPDPKKIERIKNLNPPTSHSQVRSHLGLFNYFSRFVENYSSIAAPLQELVKKQYKGIKFTLEDERLESWKKLKDALTKRCMLTHFYPERETKIIVDASAVAIGGILTQKDENGIWNPIYFFGCKLQKYQYAYRVTEKECAAVVYACRRFAHFLRHKKFTVVTDHHALCELKKTLFKVTRIMRWQNDLSEFDFDVEYLKGEKHPADCFSRSNEWSHRQKGEMPDDHYDRYLNCVFPYKDDVIMEDIELVEESSTIEKETQKTLLGLVREFDYLDSEQERWFLNQLKTPVIGKQSELKEKQLSDSRCKMLKGELAKGRLTKKYEIRDGILFRKNKDKSSSFYLPDSLIDKVFEQYHSSIEAGHFGFKPTFNKIKLDFWFPHMEEIIKDRIASCERCQEYKVKTTKVGKAKAMKIPNQPFERIQMDMIGPFPTTKSGNRVVIVCVDVLTRYGIAKPFKKGTSKEVVSMLDCIVNQFGTPKVIQSDNGQNFTSKEVKEFAEFHQIKLINSTVYHPQTNGLVERLNGIIKTRMSLYSEDSSQWDRMLQQNVYSYNTSIKSNLGKSPFQLLFNYEPRSSLHNELEIDPLYKEEDIKEVRKEVKEKLEENSEKSAYERNKTMKEPDYIRGDIVKVKPIPYTTGPAMRKKKFSGRYIVVQPYESTAKLVCLFNGKVKIVNYDRMKKIICDPPSNLKQIMDKHPEETRKTEEESSPEFQQQSNVNVKTNEIVNESTLDEEESSSLKVKHRKENEKRKSSQSEIICESTESDDDFHDAKTDEESSIHKSQVKTRKKLNDSDKQSNVLNDNSNCDKCSDEESSSNKGEEIQCENNGKVNDEKSSSFPEVIDNYDVTTEEEESVEIAKKQRKKREKRIWPTHQMERRTRSSLNHQI